MTCSGPGAAARQSRDWAQVCPTPSALSFTLCPLYSFWDFEILAPHEVLIPTCPSPRPHGRATLHVQPQPIRVDPRPDQMLRSWRCLSDQECSSNKAQPGRSFPSGPYYPPHHTQHACLGAWGSPGRNAWWGEGRRGPICSLGPEWGARGGWRTRDRGHDKKGSGGVTKGREKDRLRFPGNKPRPPVFGKSKGLGADRRGPESL